MAILAPTKRSDSCEGTPLPFGYDESPSFETLETHAELGWLPEETPLPESFQGDRRSSEGVSQVQRGVANPERCCIVAPQTTSNSSIYIHLLVRTL